MQWHYNEDGRFWFTKGNDGTFLAERVPYRDTTAWQLKAMENFGEWYHFGYFCTAGQAKNHANVVKAGLT